MDEDVGFGILRMTRDEAVAADQPAAADREPDPRRDVRVGNRAARPDDSEGVAGRHVGQEVLAARPGVPREDGQAGGEGLRDLPGAHRAGVQAHAHGQLTANLVRNVWAYLVIFCGHFPDGAEKFTVAEYENETRAEWYLRQMLGSANFDAGPVMAFMSGNLSYQIEHHLFPDLPSNRYAEMSERVRVLCEKYDLPYTTGPLSRAVPAGLPHHPQARAAGPVPAAHRRRRPRDQLGTQVRHRQRQGCAAAGRFDDGPAAGAALGAARREGRAAEQAPPPFVTGRAY